MRQGSGCGYYAAVLGAAFRVREGLNIPDMWSISDSVGV